MNKIALFSLAFSFVALLSSCTTHYHVAGVERSRILIDSVYDTDPDERVVEFLKPYKHQVDSIMQPVMGHLARDLKVDRPESELSNLFADILVWTAKKDFGENVDFSVYNIGGIRTSLSAGEVTYGDILEAAPFDNNICFLTLKGDRLMELFREIAEAKGEGVSRGVELIISHDGKLLSARLHGKEIAPDAQYRIATLDYLAEGNDNLAAFKSGTDIVMAQDKRRVVMHLICDYFKSMEAKGIAVDARIEGRIKIVDDENE